jgi:alpha-L-fucosidase 2
LEGNFAAAAAVQEMLLQSHRKVVRIFPAVPEKWQNIRFTTLRAQGAFLVSAERIDGKTRQVEVLSEKGGTLRIISPLNGHEMAFETKPGERIVLTESDF